jgi:FAD/FMN-containing dehydrogenase
MPSTVHASRRGIAASIGALQARFGEQLSVALALREQHGSGFSYHQPRPPDAVLFAASTEDVQEAVRICARNDTPVIPYGTGTRARLWKGRHESGWAAGEIRPGCMNWSTDACVPISRLAENILAARADVDSAAIPGRIIGHLGDGNFHVTYLVMPDSAHELAEAERLANRVVDRANACEGTASGEHGVGYGKIPNTRREHGASIELMRAIKQALDPRNIMNPGKMLPD